MVAWNTDQLKQFKNSDVSWSFYNKYVTTCCCQWTWMAVFKSSIKATFLNCFFKKCAGYLMIPVIWRFWLLRRNNIITTTEIKQLIPYMYQLISFKIILYLHLLVKLRMQVVFVSQKFKNYGWRVFILGTRGFFSRATRSFIWPREKTSGAEHLDLTC